MLIAQKDVLVSAFGNFSENTRGEKSFAFFIEDVIK